MISAIENISELHHTKRRQDDGTGLSVYFDEESGLIDTENTEQRIQGLL